MWFKNDGVPSLLVEGGETFTIAATDPELPVMVLRPLTTAALLVACGISSTVPARLSDPVTFEKLKTADGYVDIRRSGSQGRIDGYTASFLRHSITAIDPKAPMPTSVRWRTSLQHARSMEGEEIVDTDAQVRDHNASVEQGVVDVEMPLPEFLRNYRMVMHVAHIKDIVLGSYSTLVLDASITHLLVDNFMCYEGSQIRQESSYLAVDVMGTMMGEIMDKSAFHEIINNVLTIDLSLVRKHVLN